MSQRFVRIKHMYPKCVPRMSGAVAEWLSLKECITDHNGDIEPCCRFCLITAEHNLTSATYFIHLTKDLIQPS